MPPKRRFTFIQKSGFEISDRGARVGYKLSITTRVMAAFGLADRLES